MPEPIDLRAAMNAISDVVQNRPRPLREFDQIYMKTGDMVMQSEFVAKWAGDKRLAFIGDGDAISVCVAYLQKRGISPTGLQGSRCSISTSGSSVRSRGSPTRRGWSTSTPSSTTASTRSRLRNRFDCFYTNPPWGASNNGESVNVFAQRGMEAIRYDGQGMIVIADDEELEWPKIVLANVQRFALEKGFFVTRMMPRLHHYHLDDAPDLRSCNLIVASVPDNGRNDPSEAITDPERLRNFYGQSGRRK